jgi:hypothetical protein
MLWSDLGIVMVSNVVMAIKNMDIEPESTMLSTEGEKRVNCSGFGLILCQSRIWKICGTICYATALQWIKSGVCSSKGKCFMSLSIFV